MTAIPHSSMVSVGLYRAAERLQCAAASWSGILISCLVANMARLLLEYLVYRTNVPTYSNLLHLPVWFLSIGVLVACLLSALARMPVLQAMRIVLVIMPVLVIPPVLDALIYGLRQRSILYLHPDANVLWHFVDCVFLRGEPDRVSIGQLVLAHGLAISAGLLTWARTRRHWRAATMWIGVLAITYLAAAGPHIAKMASGFFQACIGRWLGADQELLQRLAQSGGLFETPDMANTAIFIIGIPVLAALTLWVFDKQLCLAVLRNCRLTRLWHYLGMAVLGIVVGIKQHGTLDVLLGPQCNLIALLLLLEAIAAAFVGAVWINDLYDLEIDRRSNADRPLASGKLDSNAAFWIAVGSSALAIVAASLLGAHILLLVVMMTGLAFVYSAPPLRLRTHLWSSALTLGVISMLVVQTGYSLASVNTAISALSPRLIIAIVAGIALLSTAKDIKDAEGDRFARVRTLMTILSPQAGRCATALAVFLGANLIAFGLLAGRAAATVGLGFGAVGFLAVLALGASDVVLFGIYLVGIGIAVGLYVVS